jgi:glycosyltransferase involved in cell wall biosynthesis
MRLVVDALAAKRGGLATYVRGLLTGWAESTPEDQLTVIATGLFGEQLAADSICDNHRFRVVRERGPREFWRLARTEFLLPRYQANADALLATLPTIPATWRKPIVAVVHDLRHEDRLDEFGAQQLLTRRLLYRQAYSRADAIVAISQRVAEDLASRYPRISPRISVARHGGDHIPEWQSTRMGDAVAFGHYANKQPRLLIATWKHLLQSSDQSLPRLHIVGLDDPDRASLRREADRMGILGRVALDPYLPDSRLDELMCSASVLLLPSRHEGFGLPVLEAMRRGVPVVVTPDRALHEVAGGHAAEATGWSTAELGEAVRRATSMTQDQIDAARKYASQFTWKRSAEATRAAVKAAIDGHSVLHRAGR